MNTIAIEAQNLSKCYPAYSKRKRLLQTPIAYNEHGLWALQDVSFRIAKGERVAVLGRNGSGKSTLMKILSRITAPTRGHVRIHAPVSSILRPSAGFHSDYTGEENVYFMGILHGMRKHVMQSKIHDIFAFAEIEEFMHTPIKYYSKGMKSRLSFATILHLTPEILIIDETLSGGDTFFKKKCINAMKDASQDGRTLLVVSHNIKILEGLCDRGIVLSKGKIEKDEDITSAIQHYKTFENGVETKR